MISTVLAARPLQVARIGGPSTKPMLAAVLLGGVFILTTYHLYWAALARGVGALAAILGWVWTGTGIIPEKPEKAGGHGLALPLYAYGPPHAGWWGMFLDWKGGVRGKTVKGRVK